MLIKLLVIALSFLQLSSGARYVCPSREVVSPCACVASHGYMVCDNIRDSKFDLAKKFRQIDTALNGKSKHFHTLFVYKNDLKELPENAFGNLTFGALEINNNKDLSYIHPNAFGK